MEQINLNQIQALKKIHAKIPKTTMSKKVFKKLSSKLPKAKQTFSKHKKSRTLRRKLRGKKTQSTKTQSTKTQSTKIQPKTNNNNNIMRNLSNAYNNMSSTTNNIINSNDHIIIAEKIIEITDKLKDNDNQVLDENIENFNIKIFLGSKCRDKNFFEYIRTNILHNNNYKNLAGTVSHNFIKNAIRSKTIKIEGKTYNMNFKMFCFKNGNLVSLLIGQHSIPYGDSDGNKIKYGYLDLIIGPSKLLSNNDLKISTISRFIFYNYLSKIDNSVVRLSAVQEAYPAYSTINHLIATKPNPTSHSSINSHGLINMEKDIEFYGDDNLRELLEDIKFRKKSGTSTYNYIEIPDKSMEAHNSIRKSVLNSQKSSVRSLGRSKRPSNMPQPVKSIRNKKNKKQNKSQPSSNPPNFYEELELF